MKILSILKSIFRLKPTPKSVLAFRDNIVIGLETEENKMLRMAERIYVLEKLMQHSGLASPSTQLAWVEELAQLKFHMEVLVAKKKERTLIENLTTENARLLNDLRAAENKYQRDVYGLNNEGDPIGGEPAGGFANELAHYKKLWLDSRLKEVRDHSKLEEGEYYWETGRFKFPTIVQWNGLPNSVVPEKIRLFGPLVPPSIATQEHGVCGEN
jgi:hypothetical protein